MAERMKVWIDQDLCTGDGICTEIVPDIFEMHRDGLAYVKDVGWLSILGPEGTSADGEPAVRHGGDKTTSPDYVALPDHLREVAEEAAEECPGECIFIDASE